MPTSEPDPTLLNTLASVKRACLAIVASLALVSLAGCLIPALGKIMPYGWQLMRAETALIALLGALGLQFSELRYSRWMHSIALILAVVLTLLASAVIVEQKFHVTPGVELPLLSDQGSLFTGRMSPQTAAAFVLLGIAIALGRTRKRFTVHLADLTVFCLCLLVLILVSGHIFGITRTFSPSTSVVTSPLPLLCLSLMTLVALFRRTEEGIFSIYLGRGIGSRIARILSPILLFLPFLREAVRAHFISSNRMPAHYATAILASLAIIVSLALLLFLAWRINIMEIEIHDLSLRDELTGLYNRRGFYLLAEQGLRMAHRSNLPFSVLYIDVDNLKQINDSLGHTAGSEFLAETAEILQTTLRETDVLGRIGGDEFAIAGQLSQESITLVALRLEETSIQRNAKTARRLPLSFSVGHVTSEEDLHESLDELLTRADQAMYREKRSKKVALQYH
ncbi:MAG: GGDEF domain-containing protein [Terracidiphilus sp.]|nr:GGDEF domain-containing protein [Terracidiphilus sp.]